MMLMIMMIVMIVVVIIMMVIMVMTWVGGEERGRGGKKSQQLNVIELLDNRLTLEH